MARANARHGNRRVHARCRNCRTRRVLTKLPEAYQQQPRCTCCGARNFVADQWMNNRNSALKTCYLDCYPYPHQVGSRNCCMKRDGTSRHPEPEPVKGLDLPF